MTLTLEQIATRTRTKVYGNLAKLIADVSALDTATEDSISYVDSGKQLRAALKSQAGALVTTEAHAEELRHRGKEFDLLISDDPQGTFIEIMLLFRPPLEPAAAEVSPHAHIADSATLGHGCRVGPHAVIGRNATLGEDCEIGPGAVIGDGCQLGNGCIIHANAVLYSAIELHNRVIVHANAVIGADGFGYRFVDGQFVRIPHTGTVILEDDVEIGAGSTIDRAMIGATVIGQGTKIDNLVMIAHNCQIGKHNVFASQVGLAGSCTTGDYVQMGGQVGIADHVKIGSGAKFGGKSGVGQDMPGGKDYLGAPAVEIKEFMRSHLLQGKIPEMRQQLAQLTQQIADLKHQIEQQSEVPAHTRAA